MWFLRRRLATNSSIIVRFSLYGPTMLYRQNFMLYRLPIVTGCAFEPAPKQQDANVRETARGSKQFLERIGLALASASCAVFVAAHVGRADIDLIDSAAGRAKNLMAIALWARLPRLILIKGPTLICHKST